MACRKESPKREKDKRASPVTEFLFPFLTFTILRVRQLNRRHNCPQSPPQDFFPPSVLLCLFHPSECFFTASLINGSLDVKVFLDGRTRTRTGRRECAISSQHRRKKKKERKANQRVNTQGLPLYMMGDGRLRKKTMAGRDIGFL